MQEFHRNYTGILQELVQFHRKKVEIGKNSRIPNMPLVNDFAAVSVSFVFYLLYK